ncbi:MAG: PDZ domain-containing protein, partial [Saprospiraceae bacterium]|nr:PDZ domain-containing protein [Saprospiraceae bacterium]
KNIPVLNFFTGTHTDYHKPSDDENKINYTGVEKIITYIFKITNEIGQSDKVEFTKTNATPSKSAPKYKVTMGIMPDYKDYGDGLHIDAVIENRPAQMAGLEAGDIITFIGTCPVKEVYGYMDCLSKIKSGDELEVTYMRNKEVKKTKIKF